ncbi:MAG: hypothetical protein KAV41_02380, partial [Candidatus Pacebacteria bacterium]|nr:hypothetical protein [Candidatus Paceibacterota bacterium]
MQTLNMFGQDIIKKMPILLAAALFMSGFFVVGLALAEHTAGVEVLPQYVAGGGADNYTFTVTNSGANSLISIKITVPSEFNVETAMSYSCPEGWSST